MCKWRRAVEEVGRERSGWREVITDDGVREVKQNEGDRGEAQSGDRSGSGNKVSRPDGKEGVELDNRGGVRWKG